MRTKLTIVSLVGVGVLLLAALAAISAPRAQIAYAQDPPTVSILFSLASGEGRMEQGGQLFARYTFGNIQSVTCEADLSFIDFGDLRACFHRSEVYPRNGPALACDVVATVPAGTRASIIGLDPDDDWYQVEIEGIVGQAWIYQDLTTLVGSLAGVKWVTEEELALLPAAITQPALLNARAGPGLTYDILTTIPKGTWARITGINVQGDWYRVELDDLDQPAWIFRDFTKVAGGSLTGLIQITVKDPPSPTVEQLTSSITVDLSLPQAGGVDLEVSWLDAIACTQLYNLYHRASTDTTVYISLESGRNGLDPQLQEPQFHHPDRGSSYISAWCGTNAAGREVAEVEIDPGVAGAYSSTTTGRRRPRRRAAALDRQPALSEHSKLICLLHRNAASAYQRPPLASLTAGASCIG